MYLKKNQKNCYQLSQSNTWEQEYDRYVWSSASGSFTQSRLWALVKKNWEHDIVITRDSNGAINGSAQILFRKIPLMNHTIAYAPRGPVCNFHDPAALKAIIQEMLACAQYHRAVSLKIDPLLQNTNRSAQSLLNSLGFFQCEGDSTIQCRDYYIRSLKGCNEESLFSSFHPKWRYNIRLAQRRGVTCVNGGLSALDDFYRLMQETGTRDGFNIRSKKYFSRMISTLGKDFCRLYMCYQGDSALSGAIAIRFGKTVSYVYGASGNQGRENMPNYLMQWTMMKWALQSGCSFYDFQGIPHYDNPLHPNYGVYRFKQGFRGNIVTFSGEFDKILLPGPHRMVHLLTQKKV